MMEVAVDAPNDAVLNEDQEGEENKQDAREKEENQINGDGQNEVLPKDGT